MWAYGPREFAAFDHSVTGLLTTGLQLELARRAASPRQLRKVSAKTTSRRHLPGHPTEALVRALAARDFGARHLTDPSHPGLAAIISATDLASGNAVRYGSKTSSCSAYGELLDSGAVAEAVAASCAYPLLLPPLRRDYTFRSSDGATTRRSLRLTDGGVYDNLGVSPLMPGRSRTHTSQVYDLDYLIAVDAGHGRWDEQSPRGLLRIPLARSFDITHTKNQDNSRAQLHSLAATGQLQGFLHVYLGMRDQRLPVPMSDFVGRHEIADIGTSFRALTSMQLGLVSARAEQLTRCLIDHWIPELPALLSVAPAGWRRGSTVVTG